MVLQPWVHLIWNAGFGSDAVAVLLAVWYLLVGGFCPLSGLVDSCLVVPAPFSAQSAPFCPFGCHLCSIVPVYVGLFLSDISGEFGCFLAELLPLIGPALHRPF